MLDQTATIFPGSGLRMRFTVRPPPRIGLAFPGGRAQYRYHRRPGSLIGTETGRVLLAIEDVTERVRLEREQAIAGERIGMLLLELTHRVKSSLQIMAAMVSIEARSHKSGEGKAALERVSNRINALGQLYSKLSNANTVEAVDAASYLDGLCRDLIASARQSENLGQTPWPRRSPPHCGVGWRARGRRPASLRG